MLQPSFARRARHGAAGEIERDGHDFSRRAAVLQRVPVDPGLARRGDVVAGLQVFGMERGRWSRDFPA